MANKRFRNSSSESTLHFVEQLFIKRVLLRLLEIIHSPRLKCFYLEKINQLSLTNPSDYRFFL